MSESPVKKVELTRQQRFENCLYGMGAAAHMVGALWWYVGLCWHTRRKHNRFAGSPVCIELFGSNPTDALDILKSYGVRPAYGSLQWAVIENKVALRFMFLVSKASFDYADCILDAYQGQTFDIISNPGSKRGQNFGAPWPARQPPQRPAQKQVKLGKVYQ